MFSFDIRIGLLTFLNRINDPFVVRPSLPVEETLSFGSIVSYAPQDTSQHAPLGVAWVCVGAGACVRSCCKTDTSEKGKTNKNKVLAVLEACSCPAAVKVIVY